MHNANAKTRPVVVCKIFSSYFTFFVLRLGLMRLLKAGECRRGKMLSSLLFMEAAAYWRLKILTDTAKIPANGGTQCAV